MSETREKKERKLKLVTDEIEAKTCMVQVYDKQYIGVPRYSEEELEDGSKMPFLDSMVDVYQVIPITEGLPASKPGEEMPSQLLGMFTFQLFKVGTMVMAPADVVVCELANDSLYYTEYVRVTTGIQLAGSGGIKGVRPN
jgi:hypothetical protein